MSQPEVVTRGDKLTTNAAELAELVASFPAETLLSPLGDEFCAVEHVCHLRDLERDGFTPRIQSVIDNDDPQLFDFDGAGVAAASDYRAENALWLRMPPVIAAARVTTTAKASPRPCGLVRMSRSMCQRPRAAPNRPRPARTK